MPLTVRFGRPSSSTAVDLAPKEFWDRCDASPVLPETAAPSPGAFEAAYRRAHEAGADGVVAITLSASCRPPSRRPSWPPRPSATCPLQVVDSRSVSMGLGMIVVDAARRAAAGAGRGARCAAAAADAAGRTRVYGALDTLDNLKKGGRIGDAKALLGSMLSIKPIIEVRRRQGRGGGQAADPGPGPRPPGGAGPSRRRPVEQPRRDARRLPRRRQGRGRSSSPSTDGAIVVGDLGAVIGAHAGKGTIGVVFRVP